MTVAKSLSILGTIVALSTLLFGLIFIWTRLRKTLIRGYNQGWDRRRVQTNTPSLNQANRKLKNKLLNLLHGDRDTANRLLSHLRMKNPGRSVDWCVEKAIYDLERDRGRR